MGRLSRALAYLTAVMSTETYYFLDTEWADTLGSELVSIGLVSQDGMRLFYAERDPLPASPTDFVRAVVYPLLERKSVALGDAQMTKALRHFLLQDPSAVILADYAIDLQLLKYVLAGFDLPQEQVDCLGPEPLPALRMLPKEGTLERLIETWFLAHPDQQRRRHHALVDAQALRVAWLAMSDHAIS